MTIREKKFMLRGYSNILCGTKRLTHSDWKRKYKPKGSIPCPGEKAVSSIDIQNAELTKVKFAQILFCQVLKNWCSKRALRKEVNKVFHIVIKIGAFRKKPYVK